MVLLQLLLVLHRLIETRHPKYLEVATWAHLLTGWQSYPFSKMLRIYDRHAWPIVPVPVRLSGDL